MVASVCPIAVVDAPADRVWHVLIDPAGYDRWWEVRTRSIVPEGPAQPGQRIQAGARAFFREWPLVEVTVVARDDARQALDLTTRLPFGITVHNHITCTPISATQCRLAFG